VKDQYAGDIGDYTKLGLLRAIQRTGLKIGVNWYLTPNDVDNNDVKECGNDCMNCGSYTKAAGKNDGKFTDYLKKTCDTPDAELYCILKKLICHNKRSVAELEKSGVLPGAVYYNERLDFSGAEFSATDARKCYREKWHNTAMKALKPCKPCDVVFLDPDNGLEVNSIKPCALKGNKYVTYKEAADYYKSGASVIIYNHKDFTPECVFLKRRRDEFHLIEETKNAELLCLKAPRFSVRYYFILAQETHEQRLNEAICAMLKTGWRDYMSRVEVPGSVHGVK